MWNLSPTQKSNPASRGVETSRSLPAKRHEGGIRLVEKGAGYPGYRNQRVEFPTNSLEMGGFPGRFLLGFLLSLHFWWFPGGNSDRFPAAFPGGGLFSGVNSAVSFRECVCFTSQNLTAG